MEGQIKPGSFGDAGADADATVMHNARGGGLATGTLQHREYLLYLPNIVL